MSVIPTIVASDIDRQIVLRGGPAALDFYQTSCAPCRALEPRLERVAEQYRGRIALYRVDLERDMSAAKRFDVKSIPTVIIFRDGKELKRLDGLITEDDLQQAFERATGIAA